MPAARPALTLIIPERENSPCPHGTCSPVQPGGTANAGDAAGGPTEPEHRKARRVETSHRESCSDLVNDDEWLQVRRGGRFEGRGVIIEERYCWKLGLSRVPWNRAGFHNGEDPEESPEF